MEQIIIHAIVYQVCTKCDKQQNCFILCDKVKSMIKDCIKMWRESKDNVLGH